jgi:hypothetical protein
MNVRIRKNLMDTPETPEIPNSSVSITVRDLSCNLEAKQYQDLTLFASLISLSNSIAKHGQFRPAWSIRPTQNPRAWLKYAVNAVLHQIREKKFSFARLAERVVLKNRYIEVYAEKTMLEYEESVGKKTGFKKNPHFKGLSITALDDMLTEMEDNLTAEEMFLFRSLAEKKLSD